jgi:hypothetical protein
MKLILAAAALAASLSSAVACNVTYEKYRALKLGQTLEQVERIIGCPGVEQSRMSLGQLGEVANYNWQAA